VPAVIKLGAVGLALFTLVFVEQSLSVDANRRSTGSE
jgi:hypothetical protein